MTYHELFPHDILAEPRDRVSLHQLLHLRCQGVHISEFRMYVFVGHSKERVSRVIEKIISREIGSGHVYVCVCMYVCMCVRAWLCVLRVCLALCLAQSVLNAAAARLGLI